MLNKQHSSEKLSFSNLIEILLPQLNFIIGFNAIPVTFRVYSILPSPKTPDIEKKERESCWDLQEVGDLK